MKFNLKEVLKAAGIPKPSFDSRRRRNLYSFMHESLSDNPGVSEHENAQKRWGVQHIVALRCIEHAATDLGWTLEMANSVVANNMGLLSAAIADGSIDPSPADAPSSGRPNHIFIGVVFNVVGRGHYTGTLEWFEKQVLRDVLRMDNEQGWHRDNAILGVQIIDATTIYRLVTSSLGGAAAGEA